MQGLKELELWNFQSHKHSLLKFSPGINTITGPTDNGKSSVIRALEWVIDNESGIFEDEVRNWDCKPKDEVKVRALFFDGVEVTRIRSSKINEYWLNGEVFKALRGSVPTEIVDALRLAEVNCQFQDEPYFLLDRTPGKVAQALNDVADLSGMDSALVNSKKMVKSTDKELKVTGKDITKIKQEIADYDWLDECETDVITLENLEKLITAQAEDEKKIKSLICASSEMVATLLDFPPVKSMAETLNDIAYSITMQKTMVANTQHLDDLVAMGTEVTAELARTELVPDMASYVSGMAIAVDKSKDIAAQITDLRNVTVLARESKEELDAIPVVPEDFSDDCQIMHDLIAEVAGTKNRINKLAMAIMEVVDAKPPDRFPLEGDYLLVKMSEQVDLIRSNRMEELDALIADTKVVVNKIEVENQKIVNEQAKLDELLASIDTCSKCGAVLKC